jgi:H+/gluconate symporter-like permease
LLLAIPSAVAGGLAYGAWISKRTQTVSPLWNRIPADDLLGGASTKPSFGKVLLLLLSPVLMIVSGTLLPRLLPANSPAGSWLKVWGDPSFAMLAAVIFTILVLQPRFGSADQALRDQISDSLNSIGSLLLIIGAAGALKQVIVDSGARNQFAGTLLQLHIPLLPSAFLVGAALRIALGSATASIVTAAGLIAPIAEFYAGDRVLLLTALAFGASIFANVNDAGFWMVKEYCGMSVAQTLATYSATKAVASLTGFALVCLIALFR